MSSKYVDISAITQVIGCIYNNPRLLDFIDKYNKKGRTLYNYRNILDLIKGIYRDIF